MPVLIEVAVTLALAIMVWITLRRIPATPPPPSILVTITADTSQFSAALSRLGTSMAEVADRQRQFVEALKTIGEAAPKR